MGRERTEAEGGRLLRTLRFLGGWQIRCQKLCDCLPKRVGQGCAGIDREREDAERAYIHILYAKR